MKRVRYLFSGLLLVMLAGSAHAMGLGGISSSTLVVILIIAGAFFGLVVAALVKYVFGRASSNRS